MGREQTEIDALAALRPNVLRQIADKAVAPFFDATLAQRAAVARAAWQARASEILRHHPAYEPTCDDIRATLAAVEAGAERFHEAQRQAERDLRFALPPLCLVAPELTAEKREPLYSSKDDFATATRRLIADKRLLNGGAL
jgi:hypothetical protein